MVEREEIAKMLHGAVDKLLIPQSSINGILSH